MGLSPRVRGNQRYAMPGLRLVRPIPACAGEPYDEHTPAASHAAYPRVCGGTSAVRLGRLRPRGLSPRVRGNRPENGSVDERIRPIPACAGEPTEASRLHRANAAYPRVCGGTQWASVDTLEISGLSPRVRGNLNDGRSRSRYSGPIPACAGEPNSISPSALSAAAYPRVCGGTRLSSSVFVIPNGLSPRVRGNPVRVPLVIMSSRPIPACAGEPRASGARAGHGAAYPRVCGGTRDRFRRRCGG